MTDRKPAAADHERVNASLLGRPERTFIAWFVARAPAAVTPDRLTAVGIAGAVVILAGYLLANLAPAFLWVASFGLAINWAGDSLDGNLARHRRIERPRYGFFLDHSVDSLSMLLVFLGLGVSPYLELETALLGLTAYLLMSIFVYLDTLVNKTFQITFGWFGPTEGRAAIILLNVLMFFFGRPILQTAWGSFYIYDILLGAGAIALFCTYAFMVLGRLRRLARLEPAPAYPGPQGSTGTGDR